MTYDDAGWHTDSVIDLGLEPEAAGTHIAYYLAWMRSRGLVADTERDLDLLDDRRITPREYLYRHSVPELNEYLFTDEGNRFTAMAYQDFLHAYDTIPVIAAFETTYNVPDDWAVYDAVAAMLDDALDWWRANGRPAHVR